MQFHAEINRLTFENAIAPADDETTLARLDADREKLFGLEAEIHPLQREFNQLSRHFWVTKEQVRAQRYDLSPSRYRPLEQDEESFELPLVTLDRMRKLETVAADQIIALSKALAN